MKTTDMIFSHVESYPGCTVVDVVSALESQVQSSAVDIRKTIRSQTLNMARNRTIFRAPNGSLFTAAEWRRLADLAVQQRKEREPEETDGSVSYPFVLNESCDRILTFLRIAGPSRFDAIVESTGVSPEECQNLLTSYPRIFVQDRDQRWFLRLKE